MFMCYLGLHRICDDENSNNSILCAAKLKTEIANTFHPRVNLLLENCALRIFYYNICKQFGILIPISIESNESAAICKCFIEIKLFIRSNCGFNHLRDQLMNNLSLARDNIL